MSIKRMWHDTRGQSITTTVLLMVPVLLLAIGLLYDAGAVAIAQVKVQDAADLAVQDAVKYLDYGAFYAGQQVTVSTEAVYVAQQRLAEYYPEGTVNLTGLSLLWPDAKHVALHLAANTEIPTRFLWLVGIDSIERRVQAVAVPSFGSEGEGQ